MLRETIAQNRYSFDESRNLSCGREYRAFQNPSVACGASIGTPPPQAVPLPSKEGRLGCTATAKPRGLNVSPNSLSLEMTIDGKRHIGEDGIPDVRDHPAPVISSGVSMLHEDTVKNRYSFDESRNLSCTREYRAFQLAQLRCSKCTPSAFGISSYGKATHDDLSVASLL